MKKQSYALILGGILCLIACTNNQTMYTDANNSDPVDLTVYELTPYDGNTNWQKAVKKNDAGIIIEAGDIKNNRKHGVWTTYHTKDGRIETIVGYEAGLKHGVALKINHRGAVMERMNYIQGLLEGKKVTYENNKLKEEAHYKHGKLHGERKIFYGVGIIGKNVQEEGFFQNGKRHGTNKWYNEDGEVTIEYEYVNGEKVK